MAGRQKVLGLPIGRRRKSPVPKYVAAGGGALALAVPALAKVKQLVDPGEQVKKTTKAVSSKAGDAARPIKRATDPGAVKRTASSAKEKVRPGERSATADSDNRADSDERERGRDGGGPPQKETAKGKSTNIIESIDVGVPVRTAYNAWTEFTEFPSFMKKVEDVEQESEEEVRWTGRILWSDRTWRSTILEQVPDQKIIWRSEGDKGSVDGTVTFHELTPNLTRILLVLEYHPKGFFEHVGNLWRAQGRRARLEFKNFQRHVMFEAALDPEEPEGWRGEIHEGSVAETGTSETPDEDEAPAEQRRPSGGRQEARSQEPEAESGPEDEADSDGERDPEREDRREPEYDEEEEPEYDEEEEEDGQDNEVRASRRRQSQPIRRRRTASVDDDGEDNSRSSSRRESRSNNSEEFRQDADGESQGDGRGRGGRVVGSRSGRQVGEKPTSEGAKR